MADDKKTKKNDLGTPQEKSQVINTSGGEMPDPAHRQETPSEAELNEVFDSSGKKGRG